MREALLSHYGFSRLPFGKDVDEQKIFPTEELHRSTAMLELGIESEDVMLLSGPIGCGKHCSSATASQASTPIATSRSTCAATSAAKANW